MPNSTTRLGLQEPITSDGPSELRVAMTNNATALDGAVLVSEGIFASIPSTPSPNVVGQTYYATDTGLWYFYTGSGWKALAFEVGSVLINSGTLASRPSTPSPNVVGQTYYATDTGQWYFWTGSAWNVVMLASAWSTPTATSGLSSGIQVRLVGGSEVRFRGGVQNVSGSAFSGTIIPSLGAAYTVSSGTVLPPVSSDESTGVIILEVASDTLIVRDGSIANGDFISLEGIGYSLGT